MRMSKLRVTFEPMEAVRVVVPPSARVVEAAVMVRVAGCWEAGGRAVPPWGVYSKTGSWAFVPKFQGSSAPVDVSLSLSALSMSKFQLA